VIKIQYTPGQPGARVFSRISTHEFDTREQAEYFAAIFDKSPAHMGDNLRFGWALGYLAKEMEAAPTAGDVFPSLAPTIVTCETNRRIMECEAVTADDVEPPSLIDQVRAAAPLKDGWEWVQGPSSRISLLNPDGIWGQVSTVGHGYQALSIPDGLESIPPGELGETWRPWANADMTECCLSLALHCGALA